MSSMKFFGEALRNGEGGRKEESKREGGGRKEGVVGRAGKERKQQTEEREYDRFFPLKYSRCDELLKALHKERIFSCNIL